MLRKTSNNLLSELAGIKIGLIAAEVSTRDQVPDDRDVLAQRTDIKIALSSLRSDVCRKLSLLTAPPATQSKALDVSGKLSSSWIRDKSMVDLYQNHCKPAEGTDDFLEPIDAARLHAFCKWLTC